MADPICPHCGATNPAGSAFCEACGLALPTESAGPAVSRVGTTSAGRQLVKQDLNKSMKKAFTALLIVAIMQTLAGPVLVLAEKAKMEKQNPGMVFTITPLAYVIVFGIAAVFWALAIWARKMPLPAAITGLVVFITLHAIEAVADPTTLARGFIIKAIVIVMLVNAIKAGIEYRKTLSDALDGPRGFPV